MLLDTAIFIDYLKGDSRAVQAIMHARSQSIVPMHLVVAVELIAGVLNRSELRRAMTLISSCRLVIPDESDLRRALRLLERHTLSDGVGWNDCLMAATSLRLRETILTPNLKHFLPMAGVRAVRPY